MTKQILIVEDDHVLNRLLVDQLQDLGHEANGEHSWKAAEDFLQQNDPDLILLDGRLPDRSGYDLIPQLAPRFPVVMLTAYGSVPQAVQAMRDGASDFMLKPISSDALGMVIERVFATEEMRRDFSFCKQQLRRKGGNLLVGSSTALDEVRSLLDAVAASMMTVLIQGESGSGKELVARELHNRSDRADNNFVAIDCCTLQESLFETELFGHEKGAFTGADRRKEGLIEVAERGTLFLDEIGEISPSIQAKLLRVLETGQYRRVGSARDLQADVRVVAATNRNLEEMVSAGKFRQDLFYRLNAFTIPVPPLRERREDIPLLAQHFIANHDFSRRISKRIAGPALRRLVAYEWPGNVRELRNVMERAIILSRDKREITVADLAFCIPGATARTSGTELCFDSEPSLEEIEKIYLEKLLEKYSGHRGKVSQIMGISERSVYRMIQKYGLPTTRGKENLPKA